MKSRVEIEVALKELRKAEDRTALSVRSYPKNSQIQNLAIRLDAEVRMLEWVLDIEV